MEEARPHPGLLPQEKEKTPPSIGLPPHTLVDTGAALLRWFDDGHPCITAEALARWAGVEADLLVRVGFIEIIPTAELGPGAQGEFYRLARGFRERWEHLQHG